MFRATALARKISPFCLYVKEQHAATTRPITMKTIGQKYRKMKPAEKTALMKRANAFKNPKMTQWKTFQKRHANSFHNVSASQRLKKIGELYRKQKSAAAAKVAKAAKAVKSAKPSKRGAKRTVKKAAKAKKAAKH